MYAYAHNSQTLSELNLSPNELVFHTRPRLSITFELNLQTSYRNCTAKICLELPLHSHYEKWNRNPLFDNKILSKPIPQWILATETAMLKVYSIVYNYTMKKILNAIYLCGKIP